VRLAILDGLKPNDPAAVLAWPRLSTRDRPEIIGHRGEYFPVDRQVRYSAPDSKPLQRAHRAKRDFNCATGSTAPALPKLVMKSAGLPQPN